MLIVRGLGIYLHYVMGMVNSPWPPVMSGKPLPACLAGSVERMEGCSLAGVTGFEVYSLNSCIHNAYVPENSLLGSARKRC